MFTQEDFDRLVDSVDYFSFMTYDYSSTQRPGTWHYFLLHLLLFTNWIIIQFLGPNSPLDWVRKCVELLDPDALNRERILLGMNFYGNDYSLNGFADNFLFIFVKLKK